MSKKNRKKTEAQAFLAESAEAGSQMGEATEENSADQAASEPSKETMPEINEVKPAMIEEAKAPAPSPEIPGKFRKFPI